MNYKFVARVAAHSRRRERPLRKLFVEKVAQNMLGEFRGHGREIPDDEVDAIDESKIAGYLERLEQQHSHLFIPIESPSARLDAANAELARKAADYQRTGAVPRKLELSADEKAEMKSMSAEHKLDRANGCLLAPEFRPSKKKDEEKK